ncbi:MAG TPA: type VI secretion system baseplate subunit TssF [Caulobacteraceae bacterium]
MDPRLLRAYNEELAYLRETSREFGAEHDVVAGYLGLKTPNDPDPYVERLLEGVAFLAARVKLKLTDQFPEFTQHLLQAIQPNYLSPTPSMCVVAMEPTLTDEALATGMRVPRLTELSAKATDHETPCVFRTGHAVDLYPLQIDQAEYLPSRASVASYAAAANVRAEAGLRIRFRSTAGPLSGIDPASLPIYIKGSENTPGELYRQIVGETIAVVARPEGAAGAAWSRLPHPEAYGFGDECALLPHEGRSFRGYRLLAEYFACPERFLFAEFKGLGRAFAQAKETCEVVLLFSRSSPALIETVAPANLGLFCTPAINLFEMPLGRVNLSQTEHEHLVMPDRTRPLDYEIFRLLDVTAHGRNGARPAAPLYSFGALLYDWREAIFYVTRLRPRRLSTREQRIRRRTDYIGTETFISLVAPGAPERLDEVYELGLRALVTNRELPELLRFSGRESDFAITAPGVEKVTVVRAPTRPRPPLGLNDAAWRVISHLTPNYASLVKDENDSPALLRDHLALYGRSDDPIMRRQIDGVLSVASEPVTRRVSGLDRLAFGRGQRVRIRLDDSSFENGRMFLFAAVVDRFLSEFASVNAFVETVFDSPDQGEFVKWPPRTGHRPTI